MKKKIIYGLLFAVAMVTASSSFVSCKDYEGDDYAHWQEELAANGLNDKKSLKDIIDFQIKTLEYELTNALNNAALDEKGNYGYTNADIQALLKSLKDIKDNYNPDGSIKELLATISELNKLASEAAAAGVNDSLKGIRYAWGDSLKEAYDEAVEAYEKAHRDSVKIDSLGQRTDSLYEDVKNVADSLFDRANELADNALQVVDSILNARADSLANENKKLKELLDSVNNYLNLRDLEITVDSLDADGNPVRDENGNIIQKKDSVLSLKDILEAYKKTDDILQDQIYELNRAVEQLNEDINNLFKTISKQIYGIEIQSAYSPVLGSASLPFGIQTNLLAAYAGKSTNSDDIEFPSYVSGDYASGTAAILAEDVTYLQSLNLWKVTTIPADGYLIADSAANAGKLYLTVNPTNIDFEGTQFTLVNSQNKESRIQLSPLKKSDKVLTFGWTRAQIEEASDNGFYEVNAKINQADVANMQPQVDKATLKQAVQNALNGQKRAAVKDLARAIYNSMSPLQRFGVKATWKDSIGERSVVSKYDIAAAAINPLGFGFSLPSSKYTRLPEFNKQLVADSLHIDIDVPLLIITAEDSISGKYVIPVVIPQLYLESALDEIVKDADGNIIRWHGYAVYKPEEAAAIWKFDGYEVRKGMAYLDMTPLFEELFGQFNTAFKSFGNLGTFLNKQIDGIVAQLNNYIDQYNGVVGKVNSALDNLGNVVQPVLLWSDGENVGQLTGFASGNYALGTVVPNGGSLALYPTTYSLELLAPAFKKSLIVTNVYKDGWSAQGAHDRLQLESALIAVNKDLQENGFDIFEGQGLDNPYIFNGAGLDGIDFSGMTFEFAYTAVDYDGKVAGRKFYITVAK